MAQRSGCRPFKASVNDLGKQLAFQPCSTLSVVVFQERAFCALPTWCRSPQTNDLQRGVTGVMWDKKIGSLGFTLDCCSYP